MTYAVPRLGALVPKSPLVASNSMICLRITPKTAKMGPKYCAFWLSQT